MNTNTVINIKPEDLTEIKRLQQEHRAARMAFTMASKDCLTSHEALWEFVGQKYPEVQDLSVKLDSAAGTIIITGKSETTES